MEKFKDTIKKNWIYIVVAIVILAVVALIIGVVTADDDVSKEPNTKGNSIETSTIDVIAEITSEELTTEKVVTDETIETTTVPEPTTEEVTTQQVTTEATTETPTETTLVPETTTNEESTTVKTEYNPYEILSTEFEPVDPSWERTTDVEYAFKESAGKICDCIYEKGMINEALRSEIDAIGDKWARGEATVNDFESYFKSNVCVNMVDTIMKNQWHYEWLTMVNVGVEMNEPLNHFTIKGDGKFFVQKYEELKKEAIEWTKTFFEEECGVEWDGTTISFQGINTENYFSNVRKMFVSVNEDYQYDGRGTGFREYSYIRTYYDKSNDVTHIYLATAYMCLDSEQYTEFTGTYDESISDEEYYRRAEYNGKFDPWEGYEPIS